MKGNKQHWENTYLCKQPEQLSWTQKIPQTSLDIITGYHLPKSAAIIDIGGGDSRLADFLIDQGYSNITVLDISAHALDKARSRLGDKSKKVKWIVSDITDFKPSDQYDIWHDRATFHFLTTTDQVAAYKKIAKQSVTGYMIIGTFSASGPEQCSGLPVKRYSALALEEEFKNEFQKIQCLAEDHHTPFNTTQHFLFCHFKRTH